MNACDAVAALTARGLAVFPLPPGTRRPAGAWRARRLTDPGCVRRLWGAGENIGVGCRASHLVGLDLDVGPRGDGRAVLAALADRLGQPWPDTFTVLTPSGGRHLYFRVPPACVLPSLSGGRTALGPGIDTRGPGQRYGGYLVGPGSRVPAGRYEIDRDLPLAPLPDWIGKRIAHPTRLTLRGLDAKT